MTRWGAGIAKGWLAGGWGGMGPFPLGGGNNGDGECGNGEGLGAVLGEIPAASAGMTGVGRGYDEVRVRVWREGAWGMARGLVLFSARYPRQARV